MNAGNRETKNKQDELTSNQIERRLHLLVFKVFRTPSMPFSFILNVYRYSSRIN